MCEFSVPHSFYLTQEFTHKGMKYYMPSVLRNLMSRHHKSHGECDHRLMGDIPITKDGKERLTSTSLLAMPDQRHNFS